MQSTQMVPLLPAFMFNGSCRSRFNRRSGGQEIPLSRIKTPDLLISCSKTLLISLASLAVLALGGRTLSAQSAGDYAIGASDVLAIQVFDQPDLGGKYTVEADGTFSFPLIGRVKAGGISLRAFEMHLKKRLIDDGYFRNPQVTVAVEQYRSQRVFVMGEVRAPGPVPLTGGMTLIEALSRAGSTLPSSSGEVAIVRAPQGAKGPVLPEQGGAEILRASIRDLEAGKMKQNIELQDGDTIFAPRAESVYVFGQVKNPGSYPIKSDTTLLQTLSLAGGVTPNGALNRTSVIRIVNGEKKDVKVKLTDVVEPGDTISVPERFF
jgi:polysaccharide export outer membrane protein